MHNNLVYDVGMNDGGDTAYYLEKGYRVVAIEADPELCKQVAERFSSAIAQGRLTIMNLAIADHEGVLPFWICDARPEWNSFDRSIASRNGQACHAIDVSCVTFDQVLDEHGVPYYLKIDIEGYDHLCLDALEGRKREDLPRYVSFEKGTDALVRMPLLHKLGYDSFKLMNQWLFLPVQSEPLPVDRDAAIARWTQEYIRRRTPVSKAYARLGGRRRAQQLAEPFRRHGATYFPVGTSGPFGEDTSGDWRNYKQVLEDIGSIDRAIETGVPYRYWDVNALRWIDIHARLAE